MTPRDFLRAVWPDQGYYCIAIPFKPPGSNDTLFKHKMFSSIDDAIIYAKSMKDTENVFFGVFSYKEQRVWNPTKINKVTNELGAFEQRTQSNSYLSKAFFLDIDVGEETPGHPAYASQADAISAVRNFCDDTGLPRPMIVSSGGGLHGYWLLDEAIDKEQWRETAALLHALTLHFGLKADPKRTRDTASVLRVAGTLNHKKKLGKPRPVRVLTETSRIMSHQTFRDILEDTAIRAGISISDVTEHARKSAEYEPGNLNEIFSGPQVSFEALGKACRQLWPVIKSRGDVSEPLWYATLALVRHTYNGEKFCHKISQGHPKYSPTEVDNKIAQLKGKNVGPTTCDYLRNLSDDASACDKCKFNGKVKSPIVAAKYRDEAPAPVLQLKVGSTVVEDRDIPLPPKPYKRLKTGVYVTDTNSEGEEFERRICEYDLYPLYRLRNRDADLEQIVWKIVYQNGEEHEFDLDADALYDQRKFTSIVANQSVYVSVDDVKHLRDYMIAYIQLLQRQSKAEEQFNHLGWVDDFKRFILPDRVIDREGKAKTVKLSKQASRSSMEIKKKGTLEEQVRLLQFYNHSAYLGHQFYIGASLAAPLFHMTGHHGVVVNAAGPSGASKSTAAYTAASLWGAPKTYAINGTKRGATALGLGERISALANLPIIVDEITKMPRDDMVDLAMSITQPGHRIRLDNKGVERSHSGSTKSTIMLTTANCSMHTALAMDNATGTAGSMRVFEISMAKTKVHSAVAAHDFLTGLEQNYGHIGEVFITSVMANYDAVHKRVNDRLVEIINETNAPASERFWCAVIAAVSVALELANEWGLLSYDAKSVLRWAITQQLSHMRSVVVDEYASPIGMVTEYIEHINNNIVVTELQKTSINSQGIPVVVRQPHGQLLAHYDLAKKQLWVLKKGFRDYCDRSGANYRGILEDLSVPIADADGNLRPVVLDKNMRKVLGAGTDWAKAQSWCFILDMSHSELVGIAEVAAKPAQAPVQRGNLTVIK